MHPKPVSSERGTTLAELMIALLVLSLGILAVGQLFPAGSRSQQQARMTTAASYYAQEKLEQLTGQSWTGTDLAEGRHPASDYETMGSQGQWKRWYQVTTMAAPLDNLKRVVVTVEWTYLGDRSVTATTYMRR